MKRCYQCGNEKDVETLYTPFATEADGTSVWAGYCPACRNNLRTLNGFPCAMVQKVIDELEESNEMVRFLKRHFPAAYAQTLVQTAALCYLQGRMDGEAFLIHSLQLKKGHV